MNTQTEIKSDHNKAKEVMTGIALMQRGPYDYSKCISIVVHDLDDPNYYLKKPIDIDITFSLGRKVGHKGTSYIVTFSDVGLRGAADTIDEALMWLMRTITEVSKITNLEDDTFGLISEDQLEVLKSYVAHVH